MSYPMEVRVDPDCLLLLKQIGTVGLDRMDGVRFLRVSDDSGDREAVGADVSGWTLRQGDVLVTELTVGGAAALRRIKGLRFVGPGRLLAQLDANRRRRQLAEAVLSPLSPMVGKTLPEIWVDPAVVVETHAAVLSARRPGQAARDVEEPLAHGDVLLVDVMKNYPKHHKATSNFSVVALAPNSSPLRDRNIDLLRGYVVAAALMVTIVASAFEVAELIYLVIVLVGLCILIGAVSPQEAWAAAKGSVFLVIGASFGVGTAMETSGLASAVARSVMHLVGFDSIFGVMLALGVVTSVLSNLMSNTATCVLMAPIAKQVIRDGNFMQHAKRIALMLIYSANASFSTPIATPPNLIVSTCGADYTWLEFLKFGGLLQALALITTAGLLMVMY